ncbi:glycosyltransferase family 4 protein [Blastococcus tunisiensis]|uniref:Glycosyltransferase involved in cell wall bisynthesis n=1 Tax=Blastococcus tunisiensis TaxID=1798228 RepID=A0A1I1WJ89_9ACTN|nr:glycosyltransferase family 1 protein [Blastococcus sp. DSM 46838]SFD95059.1 Glycosyltransferase involved in cell wall bisynthesis [Blastococcus sp. DSM 46838]
MGASRGPRVLVDATAVPPDRGGVGRYVDQLVPALGALGTDLAVVCQRRDTEHYGGLVPSGTVIAAPDAVARRPGRLLWEQTGLPRLAARVGADVLHCPHYTMPLRTPVPVVSTLHDATFFTHPEVHQPVKRRFFRAWTKVSLQRADACIVPSKATLDELDRVTGLVRGQVHVAHHGVDPDTFHVPGADRVAAARAHLGLRSRGYVAFLGTIEPRKNVPLLVEGWRRAVADLDDPPALVVAGGRGWDTGIEEARAAVPPELELLLPGYLPLELLAGFLGGAEVVAYPSQGEGFGLPVLEAMACGAPVLTTRALALPEVGGDAVAYADPTADGIAACLRALLDDPGRRAELSADAVRRAGTFTWVACAEQHVRTYARAIAAHHGTDWAADL